MRALETYEQIWRAQERGACAERIELLIDQLSLDEQYSDVVRALEAIVVEWVGSGG